jgi:cysteine desulfurase/selenocysteine lyase
MVIYLDNAATSFPKPESVYRAVDEFNRLIGANPGRAGYAVARQADKLVHGTREAVATLFHVAEPRQIVFTANATEALNLALKGLLQPGDRVVTTATDHNSMLRPLRSLVETRHVEVAYVPCDAAGALDTKAFEAALQPGARLICMTHASNVTGALHDLAATSALAHERGALFLVDAAQTAGCVPLNVDAMGIDLLAFTGHKGLLGPQGTGGLYIRPGLEAEIAPLREGGTGTDSASEHQPTRMPDRYEGGTLNTPGLVGLGAGVRFLLETGVDAVRAHELGLAQRLLKRIAGIPGLQVQGPNGREPRVAVVSFTLQGWPPLNLAHMLDSGFDIAVRNGLHCAPLIHRFLGTASTGTVRASLGPFNTEADVEALAGALEQLAACQ